MKLFVLQQIFSSFAKPYDQQPLRSSFETASRRRLSRWVTAEGLPQLQPAAQIDTAPTTHQHEGKKRIGYWPAHSLLIAMVQCCEGGITKDRARPSERKLQTRKWVALGHGDGLKGWAPRVPCPCWGNPGSGAGSPDGTATGLTLRRSF